MGCLIFNWMFLISYGLLKIDSKLINNSTWPIILISLLFSSMMILVMIKHSQNLFVTQVARVSPYSSKMIQKFPTYISEP